MGTSFTRRYYSNPSLYKRFLISCLIQALTYLPLNRCLPPPFFLNSGTDLCGLCFPGFHVTGFQLGLDNESLEEGGGRRKGEDRVFLALTVSSIIFCTSYVASLALISLDRPMRAYASTMDSGLW